MSSRSRSFRPVAPHRQRGAVLYVALIMLVLIALLGVASMQVSTLQERMSANYRNTNLAFQNAESSAREAECFLGARVNRTPTGTCAPASLAVEEICESSFDAASWAQARSMAGVPADRVNMRSIGKCIAGQASLALGREAERGGEPNPVFQITAYATDYATNPTADAAVDTVFMP
jgi:type IV pilus assembly protein PilX